MENRLPGETGDASFGSTDWGLIELARGGDTLPAKAAMEALCATYWYPLYAYVRRRGHAPDRAQDLTQGFFASLLAREFLTTIGPEKGKFRSYLLASCQHYLSNERDRARARKRGGDRLILSFDLPDAEDRYANEPFHELTPERLFERRWALTVLDRVLVLLGEEMARTGKGALLDRLRPALLGDGRDANYARVADEMGMTVDAVKMAAFRLRKQFRELTRQEVASTVGAEGDVDDEIRELFAALSS